LTWRQCHANFHKEEAQKTWTSLLKFHNPEDKLIVDSLFSYDANLVACIQSLHSMGDILDQIVNVLVLKEPLPEEKVNNKTISEKLGKLSTNPYIKRIYDSRKKLRDSNEFIYINAFCNMIKHRRLINIKAKSEDILSQEMKPTVDSFEFKHGNFPTTFGSEILEKHTIKIYRLVIDVGFDINEYLKNI
jgi:hypothetical protein